PGLGKKGATPSIIVGGKQAGLCPAGAAPDLPLTLGVVASSAAGRLRGHDTLPRRSRVMPLLSQPSSAAKTSLPSITLGALLVVWPCIWYLYLHANPEGVPPRTWYINYGLLATGLVLLVIGLAVGQIGRSARHAELPPPEATHQEAKIDQTAAARP